MKRRAYSRPAFWTLVALSAVLGVALGPPSTLHAQEAENTGSIHGFVLDASTRQPLAGTMVRLLELNRQELTHPDGAFHLDRIPAGEYTVVVERLGYRRETRTVEVAEGGRVHITIELSFSAISLPGVVVTGQVGARLGDDAVRSTTVVSGRELDRRLDATLGATLQAEPGLAAVSVGPATSRPVIRGLGGDRILMLEDGDRVGDLSASSPDHAVAIEPSTARQIEVLRGPAALLYGSNALGGVVNVIREEVPRSRTDRLHGSLNMQGQSVNSGFSGGGHLHGSIGGLVLRAEGSARTAGDLGTPVGTLQNTGIDTYNFSTGASWVDDWGHAGGAYRLYTSTYGIPPDPVHGHADGVHIEMKRRTVRGDALLSNGFGPFAALEMSGSYSRYHHKEFEAGGKLGTEFGQLSATGDLIARHEGRGRLSEGAIGMQLQWRDLATGGSMNTPPAESYSIAGFAIQELDLEPLRLEFGGRYDWNRVEPGSTRGRIDIGDIRTRTFGSVSGSVAALVDVGGGVGLGASIARSFRTPDPNELYSQGPHLASYSYEVGNPDLDGEVGIGSELFIRLNREDLQGEIAAFHNRINGYIYPRNTGRTSPTQLPMYQFVGEDALLVGVEGRAEWLTPDGLVLGVGGSYVRGTLEGTDEALPLIPPLKGRADARSEQPSYFLGLGWEGAAEQDRVGEFEDPTPGYNIFDASAGFRWTGGGGMHSVTLRVENLTDTEYRDHLSRIKHLMPQAGRNVSLLYRFNF